MNKLYVVAASILSLTFLNAQSITSVSSNQNLLISQKRPAAVLYTQTQTSSNGIVSDVLSNGNFIIAADDFTLATDAQVKKFSFLGFQNAGTMTTINRGMIMYVYTDNGGKPSGFPGSTDAYVAKIDLTQSSTAYTITTPATGYFVYNVNVEEALGSPLSLAANTKYWVTFAPKVNLTTYSSSERWNWIVGTVKAEKAKLIDPANAFGVGATAWTPISDLTADASYNGLAFSVEDNNNLGTTESYSTIGDIIVTQSADQLHILTKNDKSKSAVVYSADGKVALRGSGDRINIATLPKGIYIVNVTTLSGKILSTKFIKK